MHQHNSRRRNAWSRTEKDGDAQNHVPRENNNRKQDGSRSDTRRRPLPTETVKEAFSCQNCPHRHRICCPCLGTFANACRPDLMIFVGSIKINAVIDAQSPNSYINGDVLKCLNWPLCGDSTDVKITDAIVLFKAKIHNADLKLKIFEKSEFPMLIGIDMLQVLGLFETVTPAVIDVKYVELLKIDECQTVEELNVDAEKGILNAPCVNAEEGIERPCVDAEEGERDSPCVNAEIETEQMVTEQLLNDELLAEQMILKEDEGHHGPRSVENMLEEPKLEEQTISKRDEGHHGPRSDADVLEETEGLEQTEIRDDRLAEVRKTTEEDSHESTTLLRGDVEDRLDDEDLNEESVEDTPIELRIATNSEQLKTVFEDTRERLNTMMPTSETDTVTEEPVFHACHMPEPLCLKNYNVEETFMKQNLVEANHEYDPGGISNEIEMIIAATDTEINAKLIQNGNVVKTFMKLLSSEERRCSVLEKASNSLLYALEECKTDLIGKKVVVWNDCKPLTSYFPNPDENKVVFDAQKQGTVKFMKPLTDALNALNCEIIIKTYVRTDLNERKFDIERADLSTQNLEGMYREWRCPDPCTDPCTERTKLTKTYKIRLKTSEDQTEQCYEPLETNVVVGNICYLSNLEAESNDNPELLSGRRIV